MKVSIIVPMYNAEQFVVETLESVQKQTFKDIECVIVNDGSTDISSELVHEFCSKDARFCCYDKKNEGVSIARNYAIKHSTGKYILPLDADDLIEPTYVEECVNILENHPEYKLVYCRMDRFGDSRGEIALPDYSIENMLCRNCIQNAAMFRRSDFKATKGYNPNMKEGLEDWDFWISFLGDGGKVFKIDKILFHYRIRKGTRNHSFDIEQRRRLRYQMWQNNRTVYANHYMDPLNTIEYQSAISYKSSLEYRTGVHVLAPLRMCKRILKRIFLLWAITL